MFEIAGSGGLGSLNYEQSVTTAWRFPLNWRAGFSLAPIDRNNGTGLVFPVHLFTTLGQGTHRAELGLGQGITVTTRGQFFLLGNLVAGYRHAPADSRWYYRICYTPLISYIIDFQIQHWAGVSIGYKLMRR